MAVTGALHFVLHLTFSRPPAVTAYRAQKTRRVENVFFLTGGNGKGKSFLDVPDRKLGSKVRIGGLVHSNIYPIYK